MNILFIYSLQDAQSSTKPLRSSAQMQFGISYISSFLKKHGHSTKLIVLSRMFNSKKEDIMNECLRDFNPRLICFTTVSTEYQFIVEIAQYIKNHYRDIYLLIGGPHVSLNPDNILSDGFDALCIGEGEHPTLKMVSQLEHNIVPSNIQNLWIRKSLNDIEKNQQRPFIQNLDSLPFPDREMWKDWIDEHYGSLEPVLLGRGCPFQCTYCSNHALRKLSPGHYVRLRSTDNIIEEIKEIIAVYPIKKDFYLEVETVGINKKWDLELCAKLELLNKTLKQPLNFGINLRVTANADLEVFFASIKKSNFKFINIGLESGSEKVRREILKRNYSNNDIIKTVTLARKYGLKVNFFNLIGIPGETLADFRETIKVNRICQPDTQMLSIFYPYPGTDLYSLCKEQGLLQEPLSTDMERSKAVLNLPGFTKKQIQKNYIWFNYYAYKGYKPTYKILASVIVHKIHSNHCLNKIYRWLTSITIFKMLKHFLKL